LRFSHNFINFISRISNLSKYRKLWIWKNFNLNVAKPFEMILVKRVASTLELSPKKSMVNFKGM
jgi:hypothetical protein